MKGWILAAALLASPGLGEDLRRYAGAYRLGEGEFVWIAVDGSELIFGESEQGLGGGLARRSARTFAANGSAGVVATFVEGAAGGITALRWERSGLAARLAPRAKVTEEEVRFSHGEVTLAGTLIAPATPGPHPALVLVTGSGPARRDQFGGFPYLYAAMGISTLVYDKRGNGASTGTFYDSLPIEELGADVLAAVEYLKTRADVDRRRIGLRGDSQGGWVAPYVAARSADVSFLVVKSTSGLTTWDNGLFEMENDLRLEGFSERDVTRAREIGTRFNRMLWDRGEGWTALRSALEQARGESWFRLARVPDSLPERPEPANLRWVERERRYQFDPLPWWEKVKVPVLILNGGLDRNVPGRDSQARIEAALARGGNQHRRVEFYPDADHQLWVVTRLGQRDSRSRQVGLYHPTIEWLLEQAKLGR